MAPGHRNVFEAPLVTHNLLRAHASAVRAYRAIGKHQIGLVVNLETKYPASDSEEDRQAVKRADAYMNRQYLDPVYLGSYPPEMKEMFGEAWPEFPKSDLQQIREPFDFLGINYYFPGWMQHDPNTIVEKAKRVHQPQLTYTENGAAFRDPPSAEDGRIDDPLRIQYLRQHLLAARAAMRKGVDLRGYFAWSLLDNFEWQAGFSKRFGLIHVNYADQKRTIKQSGYFYRDAIARGFP
jgi:beta-glucosidase